MLVALLQCRQELLSDTFPLALLLLLQHIPFGF